jgi:hypothetical protein
MRDDGIFFGNLKQVEAARNPSGSTTKKTKKGNDNDAMGDQ